jgi:hypothetical protein
MQQITIRGLEPEIENKIRQLARDKNQSINQVLKELIHKSFGKRKHPPRAMSLRDLAGGWSQRDADEFERSIQFCEQIDKDMWQ